MERLRTEQPKGLTRAGIRKWGMLFLILGLFGRSILLNRYLGLADMTSDQLLEAMSTGSHVMTIVTVALVSQFVEACAAPIFCLLLSEGLAVISEIPFNYAMSGRFLDFSSRNPVFGMAMALLVLYLYTRYSEKKFVNLLYKTAFTIAAIFWCGLLRIDSGIICLVLTVVFWSFRKKPNIRNLMGGIAAMLCSFLSIFYMVAPMGLMVLHFYNGEKGEENRWVTYLVYPVVLIIFGIVGANVF